MGADRGGAYPGVSFISFNRKVDVLALDFDGVIADSVEECLVVGHNAFVRAEKKSNPIARLSDLDPETISEAKRLRNFIRSGQDYVYIFKAISRRAQILSQPDFDRFTSEHQINHDLFFDLFYQTRNELLEKDPKAWTRLNPLYPGIRAFLSDFPKNQLFIATTKKTQYAETILNYNQMQLQADHVLCASENHPKHVILRQLSDDLKLPASRISFVDDQVDTLIQVWPAGIRCYLAAWGYNNPDQILQARRHDIKVLSLKAFLKGF